jgi:putative copper export protein/mono/diheme cytochrome c family protein
MAAGGGMLSLDPAAAFGWSPFAIAMRVAIVALVLAAAGCWAGRRGQSMRLAGGVTTALLVAVAATSVAGHVAGRAGWPGVLLDAFHQGAVAVWLGALPAAFVLGRRAAPDGGLTLRLLRAHGPVAMVAAPTVVLTGIAGSPLVLGSARDLVGTDYGNVLVAKVTLLAVALGIGAVNHLALRGRGRAAVLRLVGAEIVVGALAVALAASMVTIQPAAGRPAIQTESLVRPAHFFAVVGPSRVHVAVSLPTPGTQAYRVTVRDALTGAPRTDVQKVFLRFSPPPAEDVADQRVELTPEGEGLWSASGAYTSIAGTWRLEAIVRRAGARDEHVAFEVDVLSPAAELPPPPDTGFGVPAPIAATWSLLPRGLPGWLPALAALAALVAIGRRPARWTQLGRGAATAALVVSVVAVGSRDLVAAANAPAAGATVAIPAGHAADLGRGRLIYLANCASCHGRAADGAGPLRTVPSAGALTDAVRASSPDVLSYRIAYGVAGTPMPAFAGLLTPDERADLVAFLRHELTDE